MKRPRTLCLMAASMSLLTAAVASAAFAETSAPPPQAPASGSPAPATTSAAPAPATTSAAPAPTVAPASSSSSTAHTAEPEGEGSLSHKYQLGLGVMPGEGYRIVVPYKENVDCGDSSGMAGRRVCTTRTPVFLDAQASFGVASRLDLIVDFRFGLEGERLTDAHQFAVSPGLRVWLDNDRELKFYTTFQGVFDSTRQYANGISDSDIGFRNANGIMYDFIRNFGLYFQFAETFGFVRWFRIEVDAGFGVQVRYP